MDSFDPRATNKRLAALRQEHWLTNQQVANLIGAPLNTVKDWGRLSHPPKCPPYAVELLELKLAQPPAKVRRKGKLSSE